jgi:uncharacterized protein YqjF (DUF2071 family)
VIAQTWSELLFAHWPVPADSIRLPAGLTLDTFDGEAWIGVVPFLISGHRPRYAPPLPKFSRFLELNVRTYAIHDGVPGVWFFSLDAADATAVWLARRTYFLPYYKADMGIAAGEQVGYRSVRGERQFSATYRPTGPVYRSRPGTLEHWLTERYSLYAQGPRGRLLRADIHHVPWPLQGAEASITTNTMSPVELPDEPPLLHFVRSLDVHIWPPTSPARR